MTAVLVIVVPLLAGAAALCLRRSKLLELLLCGIAVLHGLFSAALWFLPMQSEGWFGVDELGLPVLSLTSLLFLVVAFYTVCERRREKTSDPTLDAPEYVLIACLLFFLAAMSAVAVSRHFGMIWVAVEATTLASAPLIFFHRRHRSLEAAWKYIVLCSVGIAFAMLGNLFLVVAGAGAGISARPMTIATFLEQAAQLDSNWLKAAFIFTLVGYGTKMGLAPMHTWLPDAHSQAPAPVSALLSGALLNCAFLALLRVHAVCVAAGLGNFSGGLLVVFGLLSLGWAAMFLVRQADFKRLLAYSSIENMGILALGAGISAAGVSGAVLHMINHSFVKGALFLVAGNLLYSFNSKRVAAIKGARRALPGSGALWLIGFLAIGGLPPFGSFFSKFWILREAFSSERYWVGGAALLLLTVAFIGMSTAVLPMYFGSVSETRRVKPDSAGTFLPPALLLLAALLLGLWLPNFVSVELKAVSLYFRGF